MKKFFLLSTVIALAVGVQAQNYEPIKTMVMLTQYKKAKEDLDKGMSNAKFNSKPEAYILKTAVYSHLAMEAGTKGTPASAPLMAEAEAAFQKYKEMDPQLTLLNDLAYQNGAINIYSFLFSSGYEDYNNKNWQTGYEKFKKVVELSDVMIAKKIISAPLDTTTLLLAGVIAENANMKDDAAKYYSRIADMKVPGKDFEAIYQYLVRYNFTKKDMAAFEKYKAIGKELYPKTEFFAYDKIDFAVGLEGEFNKKLQALEESLATDPANEKANELVGELIYDTLNSRKEGAVQPANAAELEKKMVAAFYKVSSLKPDNEMPFIFVGDHFVNKAVRVNDAREAHVAAMKSRTKPGTQSSKEDVAKRDALDIQYIDALDEARDPYEKAAAIFAKKEKLTGQEKQQYKKVVGYLGDIYMGKKQKAKGNATEQAKFAAEEKKWNDKYESIK